MKKQNLKNLTIDEIKKYCEKEGLSSYRAQQIFSFVYKDKQIEDMTSISKKLREKLKIDFDVPHLKIKKKLVSRDGTVKFLFLLEDGEKIESVFIRHNDRNTLCVSTQAGCPLGCRFCATGALGFKRNLDVWEINDQILKVKSEGYDVNNIVFMGMGEPLLNFKNLMKSVYILNTPGGVNIGIRRFTVSTAGIPEGIKKLADNGRRINLAVSLNSPFSEKRAQIMPVEKKYPLADLIKACSYFYGKIKHLITFEYVLIKGFNDRAEDLKELISINKKAPCKFNLILVNPAVSGFNPPSLKKANEFRAALLKNGIAAMIRESKGADISAACGQLSGGKDEA